MQQNSVNLVSIQLPGYKQLILSETDAAASSLISKITENSRRHL